MSLTESSARLKGWSLRLADFDFTIQYRPGRVHHVPDTLSRLIMPVGYSQPQVDDDVPVYKPPTHGTVIRDVFFELTNTLAPASVTTIRNTCALRPDHKLPSLLTAYPRLLRQTLPGNKDTHRGASSNKVWNGPLQTVQRLRRLRAASDGTLEFLVQWADDTDQVWEPRAHIPNELV